MNDVRRWWLVIALGPLPTLGGSAALDDGRDAQTQWRVVGDLRTSLPQD